jgi:hypothetical protein
MLQNETKEHAELQAKINEAKAKAAKELKLIPRRVDPPISRLYVQFCRSRLIYIATYFPGSRGGSGTWLAETSSPPLSEDEADKLFLEIQKQERFTNEEMKLCCKSRLRLEFCMKS